MTEMSSKRVAARVTMTVEIECAQGWNADATADQIHNQAVETARDALRRGLVLNSMRSGRDEKTQATILGDPKVIAVVFEDRRST